MTDSSSDTTSTPPVATAATAEPAKPAVEPEESEVEKVNKENESANQKLQVILVINSIFYVAIFVVIGLPIWYVTTTTYRASLPFSEIDDVASMLYNSRIEFKFDFEFVHYNPETTKFKLENFDEKFIDEMNKQAPVGLSFSYSGSSRGHLKNELEHAEASKTIAELDAKLASPDLNVLKIYVLDEKQSKKFGLPEDYVFLNNLYVSREHLSGISKLANYLKGQYLRTKQLSDSFQAKQATVRKAPKKDELKMFNFDSEYEITFSLVNSNPEVFGLDWNIKFLVEKTFDRIISQLAPYTQFTVKSQTLLYSDFDSYKPSVKKSKDNAVEYYYLKQSDLSIMTNHMENRLGSRITNSTLLNFVVYLPSSQPMFIVGDEQNAEQTKSKSFLVQRWGGIYIHDDASTKSPKVNDAMKIFLTQFLNLIGINLNQNSLNIARPGIYSSEIYSYLTSKTLENLLNSINTLKSISLLLNKISNMVIEDDIAREIIHSLESVKKCLDLASDGRIVEAFFASKSAFVSSEKAFFDPSLLEKLYFPEDQTFAIYIPLFIPVGIPLLLSIKSMGIWYSKKAKLDREKKQN